MMHCAPSEIRKWKASDIFLMLEYTKRKSKPNVVEIEDVQTMAHAFGISPNG